MPSIRSVSLLCVVTLAAMLPSLSQAQKVTKDIVYETDYAGPMKGDLYQPVGTGPFPVVLFLHGGSWRSGGKHNYAKLGQDLAGQGYAGFSINYDLHAHGWPITFHETEKAILFLKAHAAEYHVDPNKIIVAGTSAGGQLAALAALKPTSDDMKVAAAVILSGVFDVHANAGTITRYLGVNCFEDIDICNAASPNQQIGPDKPPFFIGHGTDDHTVPFSQAQKFAEDMRKAGNTVVTFDAAAGPHMYWEKSEFYTASRDALLVFLKKYVPLGDAATATQDSGK